MEVESNKGSPLKSEPLKEGFHPPREDRDTPRANSQDECSNPGTDSHEASNKMVECSDEDDEAVDGQKCKVCGDNVGSLFGSIVCVPCKTFFLRYGADHQSFKCKFGGSCTITPLSRTRCKHCRYQRCNAVGMWKKVRPAEIQVREGQQACVVCCDIANGVHFGAITCEGCKKFFRRGLLEHDSYSCKNDKRCPINPQTRNSCRYCRYQKCLQAGMSREAIQMGRPSKMKSEALRFLRINNNNRSKQQLKKSKKRNISSDITVEETMDDEDDEDGKGRFMTPKKRKNCSFVGDPMDNPVVQTTFQGSEGGFEADYVSPALAPSYNGGIGGLDPNPTSRVDGYWNDIEAVEENKVTNGFYSKRSSLAESRENPVENLKGQGQSTGLRGDPNVSNGPRIRPSGRKNEECIDLLHIRDPSDSGSQWFNPRLNRHGSEHSSDYSASYKSVTKVTSYHELHTSATVGRQDLRADKYISRAPLDRLKFATNGPVGYVDSGHIGDYHPRHRLNEHTHLQQRNSSGGLYQNHQPFRPNNNSLTSQDSLQNNNNNNNNNGVLRAPLPTGLGNANNAQFGVVCEASFQESNVKVPVGGVAGISRESVLHDTSLMPSRLSPVKGRRSSHPDEVSGLKRSDPRGLQRAMVGKSMMKLMEEHDKVYNPRGQQQQCESHSGEHGEPVSSSLSSSSTSSSSSSSSSSLLTKSSLLMNIHASRIMSSATLNSSSGVRPSRTNFSSSATGGFSRQQSPVTLGGDRSSPYSSVMMLLSSCQLFNEASKNPFQLPSDSEASPKRVEGSTTCNSSVADSLDEESAVVSSRNARITRLLDSPEQSRITEAYWLRHDELPDESLMLNDKHFDVIHQIVLAYEKFLQCGTNINVTLKKELESWNLHSQVPLQGSISLPEWIQVKVIPVYTYTSITYCKSLPGFIDLPLTDQATLIRLGQTQSRIMLAAVHWFDSQKKNFEDFLSWRPLDLFKQRLISYAEKIQKLQLDFIESALLNALIIIAADFPGLENPILINQLRQRILLPFRAYTTAKFGTPNHRMESLFRHIPETRQLGFLHYKMTMKASLRAEEVERHGD